MSGSQFDQDVIAALGAQQSLDQTKEAVRAIAAIAATFRESLMDGGFSRSEANVLVAHWLICILTQNKPRKD